MADQKLALLFDHFGPYHVARAKAAAARMDLAAIETSAGSFEYGWTEERPAVPFPLVSLFGVGEASRSVRYGRAWIREMRSRLFAALDRIGPAALAVPGWSDRMSFAAVQWAMKRRIPIVLMSESQQIDGKRSWITEAIKRRFVRVASSALVGGGRHRDYLVSLGMRSERIFLGYNAVDNAHFTGQSDGESAGTGATPHFAVSARFIEKKNLKRLLAAYRLYRRQVESTGSHGMVSRAWDLELIGDGPQRSELESIIRAENLQTHVRLPGFIQYSEIPGRLSAAAAFILPSSVEPWGLVVNEAMASGLPVLVSNRCGCASELVTEGVNGWTFAPESEEELARLMHQITVLEPSIRKKMGMESRRIIEAWGPERFGQGIRHAFEAAMEAGPGDLGPTKKLLVHWMLFR